MPLDPENYRGVNLSGARFHNAVAIERQPSNPKRWIVECLSCGRSHFLSIPQLVRGKECPRCKNATEIPDN